MREILIELEGSVGRAVLLGDTTNAYQQNKTHVQFIKAGNECAVAKIYREGACVSLLSSSLSSSSSEEEEGSVA